MSKDENSAILRKIFSGSTVYNEPLDFLSMGPSMIHQIWIGPRITKSALHFNRSLTKHWEHYPISINYWINPGATSDEDYNSVIDSVKPEIDDEDGSVNNGSVRLIIRDIRTLSVFKLLSELKIGGERKISLYDSLYQKGSYNYIKELFTFAILYKYGGYYFDTTFELDNRYRPYIHSTAVNQKLNEKEIISIMPEYKSLVLGTDRYKTPDVYYAYSPQYNALAKITSINAIIVFYVLGVLTWLKHKYESESEKVFSGLASDLLSFDQYMELVNDNKLSYSNNEDLNSILHILTYRFVQGKCFIIGNSINEKFRIRLGETIRVVNGRELNSYALLALTFHVRSFLPSVLVTLDKVYGKDVGVSEAVPSFNGISHTAGYFSFVKITGMTKWQEKQGPIFSIPGIPANEIIR